MQKNLHVSIEQSFKILYLHWIKMQNFVIEFSKKSKQQFQRKKIKQQMTKFKHDVKKIKNFMQQMQKMQKMQIKQRMQKIMKNSMKKQIARMKKKEQFKKQRKQLKFMKAKKLIKTQISSHQSSMHEIYWSFFQFHFHFAFVNVFKQLANDQSMFFSMFFSLLLYKQFSNSIKQPQNEFQTMKKFFDWKIKKIIYKLIIKQFTAVRQTVKNKIFKFKHLKAMFDSINFMHRKTIELNISNDMILNFAHDLKQFKQN